MITIKNYEMGGAAWGMQKHTTLFASGVRNVTLSEDELSAPAHDASCARMTFRPRSSVGPESAPVKNLANILTFFWREVLPPISHFLISSFDHNVTGQARCQASPAPAGSVIPSSTIPGQADGRARAH